MSETADGVFNMYTGFEDIDQLALLNTWNYKTETGVFPGECGKVQGSMGEVFPPNSADESEIKIFANDLCRYQSIIFSSCLYFQYFKYFIFSTLY